MEKIIEIAIKDNRYELPYIQDMQKKKTMNKLSSVHFICLGEYAGFDENEPTSRSGGKGLVVRRLKEQHGYQRLVIVGDGATDAEASPPADGFIG